MTPIVSLYGSLTRVNTNFIGEMKTFSADKLAPLMMRFNNIRNEENIDVLVFIETRSDGPSRVVSCAAVNSDYLVYVYCSDS